MLIRKVVHKENVPLKRLDNSNFMDGRIGFWAIVKEQNSLNNTVTVVSDTGFEYENIPVFSNEWVTVDEKKNYIPSSRNLPPKCSRVFVLTPTFTATGAFVLCSGFSRGDENIRTLWAKNENELNEKNNSRETITQGGWHKKEEYSNGNYSVESNDGNIKLNVNTTEDSQKSQPKEVSITAWNNKIVINADGIEITDKTGNKIKTTSSNIEVYAKTSNKIKIGNGSGTIKDIISALLTKLNSGSVVTAGNETAQSITASQFTAEITKLNQVLE